MSTFSPTPEQLAIVEAARETTDNLLISALAGAAKTSTLVLIAEALKSVPTLCLAFNKRIATEMQERLPGNCEAKTLNGLGHQVWGRTIGRRLIVDTSKNYKLLTEILDNDDALDGEERGELRALMSETLRAIESGKTCGYIPDGKFEDTAKRLMGDDEFFAWLDEAPTAAQQYVIRKVSYLSIKKGFEGVIDFNDQILLPTVFKQAKFPVYPLVMVDEAQDLSALNHATLRKLAKKRLIAVGDPCQPDGTLITRVKKRGDRWNEPKLEQVPIEEIREGDIVLGHNANGSFMYNRRVQGITRRPFEGELVVAGPTRYTPNHHCYARFASLADHWCVYLMQKGSAFRIGKARMSYGEQGLGPQIRAKAEGADAMWILATYEDEESAFIAEAVIQTEFGLSDLCFVDPNRPWLDSFWKEVETFDLEARARACLAAYHREFRYPLWRIGDSIPAKRPFIVRACNLLDGCELLPFNGDKLTGKDNWTPYRITYEPYSGYVTSFTISDNHLYVADGIVTHNCQSIYGFRGAHEDSMSKLQQDFAMRPLHLTVSFRCPRAVVEAARWRAPHMQYPEWAKPGEVRTLERWTVDDLPPDAVILCRNNAPLFKMGIALLRAGRYPEIVGNDIGKSLLKHMEKLGPGHTPRAKVYELIDKWEQVKSEKARDKGKIIDQAECMRIFAEQGATLSAAVAYAKHLFDSAGPVKLMTMHKSKGLEFDNVFLLDKFLVKTEDHPQERNLLYVGITRAKSTLTYVRSEDFR